MSPSPIHVDQERGWIVPIGGAEDKLREPTILRRFVEISGGSDARIVVIPTASQLDDTGSRYERIFTDLGAGFCLVFSGFITTNAFQIGKYSTWVAIVAFASGPFLILCSLMKYCCGWEALEDSGSPSERQSLLEKGNPVEPQKKAEPDLVPEEPDVVQPRARASKYVHAHLGLP